ncbi:MAG: hypothetical protein BMS9Abin02_1773 [Anaerolineae bacterium]|nr:MAG: hypothetical protein BMS9Abin02_1773 [Anaerolineae bacterium]
MLVELDQEAREAILEIQGDAALSGKPDDIGVNWYLFFRRHTSC